METRTDEHGTWTTEQTGRTVTTTFTGRDAANEPRPDVVSLPVRFEIDAPSPSRVGLSPPCMKEEK